MKILIAEDDPIMLDSLSACIKAEGFTAFPAANGKRAIDLYEQEQIDLLCLDIMMPEMNGFEVCQKIRESNKTIPILFLSAKNEEKDIVYGLDLGGDDFIRKPFTRNEVMARIRVALRRLPTDSSSSFSMLDLVVSPKQLSAHRGNQIIELTPREASILQVLYDNKNHPVSRNTLLDKCWGIDYFPDSRTLDQHILTLRKKIEHNPSLPKIIATVRSVGYKFTQD